MIPVKYINLRLLLTIFFLILVFGCDTGTPIHTNEDYYRDLILAPSDILLESEPSIRSGKLSLASPIYVEDMDVHMNNSPILAAYGPGLAYSRLLRFRSGSEILMPTMATECDLCDRWSQLDSTTYEFHIRDDAYWHDIEPVSGRQVNSEDIIQSFKRQLGSKNTNAEMLKDIKTMEAIDEDVVRITVHSPNSDFLSNLAQGVSKIVPIETNALGATGFDYIIGSGPWIWQASKNMQGYYFEANPIYYEEGIPYSDNLEIQIIPDPQTRLTAFLLGKIDILELERDPTSYSILQENNIKTAQQLDFTSGLVMSLNTLVEPLDRLGVRREIIRSLDPWSDIAGIWENRGFVSLGIPVMDKSWIMPRSKLETYFRSGDTIPGEGIDLGGDAINIKISVAEYSSKHIEYGNRVAQSIGELGLRPTVELLDINEYARQIWKSGHYQIFIGPSMPLSSTNSYLSSVFHSRGKHNLHNYRDEYLDVMIDRQVSELDFTSRKKILMDLQEYIISKAFWIMPVGDVASWAIQDNVRNFHPNTFGLEYFYFAETWIDGT
ncbi:MAG: ABC transporter substrate-binding protein [Dehalococcoidia bacterium]|nr:ABC transporter substrate-binding protein [Dehalococcoidia bacterium]